MKILTDYEDLVGKEVAFSHMATFAEHITIGTKCGCVLMAEWDSHDEFGEGTRIRVCNEFHVMQLIKSNNWLREELGKLGIFDLEKYQKEKLIEEEKAKKKRLAAKEVRERAEYERLKEKFEA